MQRRALVLYSLAVAMAIAGLPLIGLYSWSVWSVMDQADQSIIFWYLPFLLFGLMLLGGAVTFVVLAWVMQREGSGQDARVTQTGRDDAHG